MYVSSNLLSHADRRPISKIFKLYASSINPSFTNGTNMSLVKYLKQWIIISLRFLNSIFSFLNSISGRGPGADEKSELWSPTDFRWKSLVAASRMKGTIKAMLLQGVFFSKMDALPHIYLRVIYYGKSFLILWLVSQVKSKFKSKCFLNSVCFRPKCQ